MTQSVKGCQLSKLTAKTFIFHAWADLWFYHWGGGQRGGKGKGIGGIYRSGLQQKMLSGGSDVFFLLFASSIVSSLITSSSPFALCLCKH